MGALQDVALRLDYMVGQITPEEFSWQDANYDHDSALGRELLFLIADNRWVRATSETIDIARSDAVDTTVKIDVDLDRITHEAFRGRAGQLWLPVLVLPPLQQRLPEPDPFSTLAVADASGDPLATLPNADVRHRIAAALTEIILNVEASLPDAEGRVFSATRDHRLLLSAAIYRLLRSEHVPTTVMGRTVPPRPALSGPLPRIGRVRRELGALLEHYSALLAGPASQDHDAAARDSAAKTTYGEKPIDLPEFITQNRQRLALKPNDDYSDQHTYFGWEMDSAGWDRALKLAMRSPYVVQERVEPVRSVFPLMTYGHLEFREMQVDVHPHAYLGKVQGCSSWLSMGKTGFSSAAGIVPTFILDSK